MVGRNMSLKNPVTPPGINPGTVQLVVQRLKHYTISGPMIIHILSKNEVTNTLMPKTLV